jgi:hypothetical protein
MNDATNDAVGSSRSWLGHQLWLLKRRRGFLVNPRWQLRAAFLTTLPVLLLLVLVNILFYVIRVKEMEMVLAIAPSLEDSIRGVETSDTVIAAVASSIILALVFVVTIFETHRTSGAAVKIRSRLLRVAEGRYDTSLELREGDNLRELEEPFEQLTGKLRETAAKDAQDIDRFAERLGAISTDNDGRSLADELRNKASEIRERTRDD